MKSETFKGEACDPCCEKESSIPKQVADRLASLERKSEFLYSRINELLEPYRLSRPEKEQACPSSREEWPPYFHSLRDIIDGLERQLARIEFILSETEL